MNEQFTLSWNTTGTKFTPSNCEWLCWIGQPLLYDTELCVNRSPEEHNISQQRGSLVV